MNYSGQAKVGLELARKAVRLNPHCPEWYTAQLGQIYFDAHRYEEAIATLAGLRNLDTVPIRLTQAASHAALGHTEEAHSAIERVFQLDPQATLEQWTSAERAPYKESKDLEHFRGYLRKAGLPK